MQNRKVLLVGGSDSSRIKVIDKLMGTNIPDIRLFDGRILGVEVNCYYNLGKNYNLWNVSSQGPNRSSYYKCADIIISIGEIDEYWRGELATHCPGLRIHLVEERGTYVDMASELSSLLFTL